MIDLDKQRDGLITWLHWHQTNHDLHHPQPLLVVHPVLKSPLPQLCGIAN